MDLATSVKEIQPLSEIHDEDHRVKVVVAHRYMGLLHERAKM